MAKTTTKTYAERISRTETEVAAENRELTVEQAQNTLEQGILSVKSQMISAESDAKKAKNAVSTAEKALEKTVEEVPLNVQNILDARTAVKQAQLDATSKDEAFNEFKAAHDYLVALKTELFPA